MNSFNTTSGPSWPGQLAPGTVLNGMFQIEHWIGSGGMGDIYRGAAIQTGDPVAIKLMRSDLAEDQTALALFRKEASILHNLLHEAIVRYYVFSVDPVVGRPYLVMEFVQGQPLSDVLRDGALSFEDVQILRQRLASGLQAAHALGVVHRDISPDNIILQGRNVRQAKIIDFGIARAATFGGGTVIGGGFAGKHSYASPEQLGLYGGEVTGRSDVYSLGLVLAEALTGRPLGMDGSYADILEKRRSVPDLSHLDRRIAPLIQQMLAPHPQDRPASMAEIAAWQGETGRGKASRPATAQALGSTSRRFNARSLLLTFTALAVVVALATVIAIYALDSGPPLQTAENSEDVINLPAAPAPKLVPPSERAAESPVAEPPPSTAPVQTQTPAAAPASAVPAADPSAAAPSPQVRPPVEPPPPPSAEPVLQPPATVDGPQNVAPAVPVTPVEPAPPIDLARQEPPPVTLPLSEEEQTARYIRDYDGGSCFFAYPTAISDRSAEITVFGAYRSAVEKFNADFLRARGFDPNIRYGQITPEQCPATVFLKAGMASGAAPRIELARDRLKAGDPLTGELMDYGSRELQLFLVAGSGLVSDISQAVRREAAGGARFSVPTDGFAQSSSSPVLLLVLAGDKQLATAGLPAPAGQALPRLLADMKSGGAATAVGVRDLTLSP